MPTRCISAPPTPYQIRCLECSVTIACNYSGSQACCITGRCRYLRYLHYIPRNQAFLCLFCFLDAYAIYEWHKGPFIDEFSLFDSLTLVYIVPHSVFRGLRKLSIEGSISGTFEVTRALLETLLAPRFENCASSIFWWSISGFYRGAMTTNGFLCRERLGVL
ncbi:hypothetical protein DFS33DRAFT_746775 [Desarmillaria ectypa]|nr:hypothetical protein DFS33DRAFT_746775 [Desarmillaria ectypa]